LDYFHHSSYAIGNGHWLSADSCDLDDRRTLVDIILLASGLSDTYFDHDSLHRQQVLGSDAEEEKGFQQ